MNRFGDFTNEEINKDIDTKLIPRSTKNTKGSIWKQFVEFCKVRKYELVETTTIQDIAAILKDWAYNMKKKNGEDYKECVVKTIWNSTAKMVQEKYFKDYKIEFNPFTDIAFREARDAKNCKRKQLQCDPDKRKVSSVAIDRKDILKMAKLWNLNEPEGLQKRFFHIASFELAWRGSEAVGCKIFHFKEEKNQNGTPTGRLEYNPIFSKTCQGGSKKLADSKWLTKNDSDQNICPVHLFKLLLQKRNEPYITSERLFLTPNPFWNKCNSKGWYKNMPLGINSISTWTKTSAKMIGLDIANNKITNHSNRASTVSHLAKAGISDQQLIKITGHSSSSSIKPYLQLDSDHHESLINSLRATDNKVGNPMNSSCVTTKEENYEIKTPSNTAFNNCVFNNCSFK